MSTTKQRVVVLISGNGSNLQAIIERLALGDVPAHIVAVISNRPQAYGLERARAAGIPTQVIDHQRFSQRAAFDHALAAELHALKPSVILLAGFMRILSDTLVKAFRGQLINIHPSLLPAYRGRNTHSRVLAAGDSIHGCSVHYVTPDLDAGPVIAQARLTVQANDSPESLAERVQTLEHQLYPEVLGWIAAGRVSLDNDQVTIDGVACPQPPCIDAERD
ncbi:MAG: phosphoribosylglycinamide formyltransferase [Spiribacter sp.]|nr:phosphoribosylglycinamide formyltransferase [Spiribacter sp.]